MSKFTRIKKITTDAYYVACSLSDTKSFSNAKYLTRADINKGGMSILITKCACGKKQEFKDMKPHLLAKKEHWIQISKMWRCPDCRRNYLEQ